MMAVSQRTDENLPTIRLSRGCRLLLFVMTMALLSASAASAYDLAAGGGHTCALHDNGVTCWGANIHGQSTVPVDLVFSNILDAEIDIKPGGAPNPINPF